MFDDDDEEEGRFRKRRPAPVRRGVFQRLGILIPGAIILSIVPLAVSLWARGLAADYVPMLKQATPESAAGNAAVVALSFSLVLFLQFYAYWKMGPSAGGEEDAPVTGWVQFLIVYVLLPLLPGLAVGYVTLAPSTPLAKAVEWVRQPSGTLVERQVGQAIQDAAASETRVAGLRALAQFASPEALNELARLAVSSPRLLNDPPSFERLASALASFGSQAEPRLQDIWKQSGNNVAGAASVANAAPGSRTPADLVLAAYGKLDTITDKAAAYVIAREAAASASASAERRAAAIAVVAKSGSKNDYAWLASYLANQPEPVKQAALDALRRLDARLRKTEAPAAADTPAPAGR